MLRLRAVPRSSTEYPEGPASEISVSSEGQLQVRCDDNATYEWLTTLLADRLFVQGLGFPKLKRGSDGALTRNPASRKHEVVGYVNLAQPARQILEAIRDNLEATEQFELSWTPCLGSEPSAGTAS